MTQVTYDTTIPRVPRDKKLTIQSGLGYQAKSWINSPRVHICNCETNTRPTKAYTLRTAYKNMSAETHIKTKEGIFFDSPNGPDNKIEAMQNRFRV